MANQEHLDILMQGVEVWNRWREEQHHQGIRSDRSFFHSYFSEVDLTGADLCEADFNKTYISDTVFRDVDLSEAKRLDTVKHQRPSTIGIDTIIRSRGNIPEIFLRGAGVPQSIIEQIPALVGSLKPIDYYT